MLSANCSNSFEKIVLGSRILSSVNKIKDGGSPAARLWFARFTLARLGLNDGA